MGNNFSVSYSNNDIELFNYLKDKLPRQYSLSNFCMEWIKKGIDSLKTNGTSSLDTFQEVIPRLEVDNFKWRNVVKNISNEDLKNMVNNLNQKINIVNRELQKRV